MTCDAKEIVNWFIGYSAQQNCSLSIMTLLKLANISHGWFLALYDRPLFNNSIEAWKYGPVVPDIYFSFRNQGSTPTNTVTIQTELIDDEINDFLVQIYNIYGSMSPFQLSDLTHVAGGPWDIIKRLGGFYSVIPNDLIKQHYVGNKQQDELAKYAN